MSNQIFKYFLYIKGQWSNRCSIVCIFWLHSIISFFRTSTTIDYCVFPSLSFPFPMFLHSIFLTYLSTDMSIFLKILQARDRNNDIWDGFGLFYDDIVPILQPCCLVRHFSSCQFIFLTLFNFIDHLHNVYNWLFFIYKIFNFLMNL